MRILYLSPSGALGGAERALLDVFRSLRADEPGWQLGMVAFEDGPAVAAAAAAGVDAMVAPMPEALAATGEYGRSAAATVVALARGAAGTIAFTRSVRRCVDAWAPDILHSNGIKAHVIGQWIRGRVPVVWHVHDYLSPRTVSARLLRHSAGGVALVLANSRSVADDVRHVLGSRVRVETLYNAVDVERFRPEGPRFDLDAAAGLDPATEGVVRVGLVATFARWKGHDVFLRALATLSGPHRVRGYVIGGPVYRTGHGSQRTTEELYALRKELGLERSVGFIGFLDEPASAYRSLDVVVHASTRPEPFGLSIAEAMASGCAVIVSDAGGAREIGEPGRMCLVHPPGDVRALADAISRLASDSELRQRLGRTAAGAVAERFSPRALATALGSHYRELAPCAD